MTYFCRLVWNKTKTWDKPCGTSKGEAKDTFASRNGFGYDEWLNQPDWIIDETSNGEKRKTRYSFLRPFTEKSELFEAREIRLFTMEPNPGKAKKRYRVGTIINCSRLSPEEAKKALDLYGKRGWLDQMKSDVTAVGKKWPGVPWNPLEILNVKFDASDIRWVQFPLFVKKNHMLCTHKFDRYKLGQDQSPKSTGRIQSF